MVARRAILAYIAPTPSLKRKKKIMIRTMRVVEKDDSTPPAHPDLAKKKPTPSHPQPEN
jgi:hypothetical protein